jgi:diadenosine tetraphosphate (Ap4A) HIT family hydrolase
MGLQDIDECILCRDVAPGERRKSPYWIADLRVSTAFLARNQVCRGYVVLVYNKSHVTELHHLERDDLIAFMDDLVGVSAAIDRAYRPRKLNYELLGNLVPHLHWHVIPRRESDPIDLAQPVLGKDYAEVRLSPEEYAAIIAEIRAHAAF